MTVQGAEAHVETRDEKIIKDRRPKNYRHRELDERIRKERTEEEAKNINRARKYGVKVPETDKTQESVLEQEKIPGKKLKNSLKDSPEVMKNLGENIGKMHSAEIIHGDLTTSNVIQSQEKGIYIIDFGLSQISDRIEDKAVDIHLLKQVLESSHPEISSKAWEKFLEGYRDYGESKEVLERLGEVESRGRYK